MVLFKTYCLIINFVPLIANGFSICSYQALIFETKIFFFLLTYFCLFKNKGKAALGKLVHKKTATAVALTEVRNEDKAQLENFITLFDTNYNHNEDLKKTWGGGILGSKSQHRVEAQAQAIKEEQIKKANL